MSRGFPLILITSNRQECPDIGQRFAAAHSWMMPGMVGSNGVALRRGILPKPRSALEQSSCDPAAGCKVFRR
jgi:hypothetical protein